MNYVALQQSIAFPDLLDPRQLDAGDESDGWYTPPWIVEAAREVLGGIDMDPATCAAAQSIVKAGTWYTEAEDGLAHIWHGRLWLNPPYSAPTVWVRKAIQHYKAGDVPAALIITNSYTETGWWQDLAAVATILFFRGRINFWHPEKTSTQNRTGQTMAYLGSDVDRFRAVFGRYGAIR